MTQKDKILHALKQGRRLTPQDALDEFGCFRLAARIKDLRDDGVLVERNLVKANGAQFAEYYIPREPVQQELF